MAECEECAGCASLRKEMNELRTQLELFAKTYNRHRHSDRIGSEVAGTGAPQDFYRFDLDERPAGS